MRTLLFLACLVFTGQTFAQSGKAPVVSWSGNKIINHTHKPGPKAQVKETVMVQLQTWLGDSLFISTRRDFGGPRELVLPPLDQFGSGRVPAVLEAILQMAEGDSVTVYETLDSTQRQGLPEGFSDLKTVRYEIVTVDILTAEELQKLQAEAEAKKAVVVARAGEIKNLVQSSLTDYKAGKLGTKLQKSASGLEYLILEKGTGAPIQMGEAIATHYYGVLKSDGMVFDNSFERGESVPFTVGQLIPGFNEGMMLLNRGGKAILFIPAALAYGEQGAGDAIPPNSDLIFYLEL